MRRMREPGSRQTDEFSLAFEGSRNAVNSAIDKICDFTGIDFGLLIVFL